MASERVNWKTRTGFLMAVIGSAVGLGNIWRFPYVAYKGGGGAFLLPYTIALILVGIPLMMLELALGHKFRASAPLAFSRVGRKWELLGWWSVIFVFVGILMYYCVVISWCLNYLVYAVDLSWGMDTSTFFEQKFLGISSGPYQFGGFRLPIVIGLALVWLVNWWIVFKGIRRGIEKASKILIPFLFVIMVVLIVWSLTLPGASSGIKEYFWPNFSKLKDLDVWSFAFSQIFFSLSLGFGIIVAYSSYLPPKTNIKSSALITSISDFLFAVFAGVAVFATLGYMSSISGKPIDSVVRAGPGLAFVTYPEAINVLPFGANVFGVLFFLSLLFAGISSSISIFEATASSIIDKFGWSRKKTTTIMSIIGFLGGLIFTTGAGIYWLDVVDFFINNFGLLAVGVLEAVAIGWIYKSEKLRKHINESGESAVSKDAHKCTYLVGKWWDYALMIWIPIILGVIVIMEFVKQLIHPYSGYKWIFIGPVGFGWLIMTFLIAWYLKRRSWRKPRAKEEI